MADLALAGFNITNLGSGGTPFGAGVVGIGIGTSPTTLTPINLVTPEMFGAIGDGAADDTTALQSAINSGSAVFLQKKYRITSAVSYNPTTPLEKSLYMFGRGLQSQIILDNSATSAVNITLSGNGYSPSNGTSLFLADFAIVQKAFIAGTVGMLNISETGTYQNGTAVPQIVIRDVTAMSISGTPFNNFGLTLLDVRHAHIRFHVSQGAVQDPGTGTPACIRFTTSNDTPNVNAPGGLFFDGCELIGGAKGIQFVASGAGPTTPSAPPSGAVGTMDPQGVWITDCMVIGQTVSSIDLAATDANNIEWRVSGCSLAGGVQGALLSGIGSIRFIDNTISAHLGLVMSNTNCNWLAGHVKNNVFLGSGSPTSKAIDASGYNWPGSPGARLTQVGGNSSLNCGGGYVLTGNAINDVGNNQ